MAEKTCAPLLLTIRLALSRRWYVVVASSSGSGWLQRKVSSQINAITSQFHRYDTRNFTHEEMTTYIEAFQIDSNKATELSHITGGNPLLLGLFQNTTGDSDSSAADYQSAMTAVSNEMNAFVAGLVDVSNTQDFLSNVEESQMWLVKASTSQGLTSEELQSFRTSYVAQEHLVSQDGRKNDNDEDEIYLKFHFPATKGLFDNPIDHASYII